MKFKDQTPETCPQVIVTWRDIREISSWSEEEEIRCCRKLQTIGWLLYEGSDPGEPECGILIIAKTYDYEEERWADFTVFPKTVIKGVKKNDQHSDGKAYTEAFGIIPRGPSNPDTGYGDSSPPEAGPADGAED